MLAKFSIFHGCIHRRAAACDVVAPISSTTSFSLREEYADAFRTESYNKFWSRVLDLTLVHGAELKSKEHSAAARLPSYHVFAENLVDPSQATVSKILTLAKTQCHPENHILLTDYYTETANASLLCSLLLGDIEQIRLHYRLLKSTLNSLVSQSSSGQSHQAIDHYLADLSMTLQPFNPLALSQRQFHAVQDGSANLLKRLELSRKKARAKLRFINRLKRALGLILVALTASISVVGIYIAVHALFALLALPLCLPATARLPSTRWLAGVLAQLDTATKGAYILNRDLDTISRLVARLHDEVEHMLALLWFCLERNGDRRRLMKEVVRLLVKNDASFNQQLDELEEHLYLCFMTINKARSLVMKEILVPSRVKVNQL